MLVFLQIRRKAVKEVSHSITRSVSKQLNSFSPIWATFVLFFLSCTLLSACGIAINSCNGNNQCPSNSNAGTQPPIIAINSCNGSNNCSSNPTPTSNPYPPYKGTLALNDPLANNSEGYKWEEGTRSKGQCTFTGGSYHIITKELHSCLALAKEFGNFTFEVHMTIISAEYSGIAFRAERAKFTTLYCFLIDLSGNYYLEAFSSYQGASEIAKGSGIAMSKGSNQLAVVAQGKTIDIYVNERPIAIISDSTYKSGHIGVITLLGEAAFTDAKVWV